MKKLIILILFLLAIGLVFITFQEDKELETKEVIKKENREVRGVFISYIDYGHLKNKTKEEQENLINEMINNISYYGLNSVILQVRPFSDAIYKSDIYQSSKVVVKNEGDPLKLDILDYFIKQAKIKDIEVYAWVNPYRIRNENDKSDISKDSYYYKWFGTEKLEESKEGIYLNPASSEVLDYINKGLKELCENYDIKGVIYDDYYHPTETIDLESYEKTDKKLTLKEYRIENINKLLETSYETIKSVNKELKFGISPAGNIENNLSKEYLDIENILKDDYLDLIIPQLYFGFNNSNKPYIPTLEKWSSLNVNNKDFYVALALYKSGKVDEFAGKGENEWLEESNIIKKQVLISRNENNYKGFYIYRYEYLFEMYKNENLNKEISNLKSLLDE